MGLPISLDPGVDYFVRARVAEDKEHWDAGDMVRMRLGAKGFFQTLWIPRSIILPAPAGLIGASPT